MTIEKTTSHEFFIRLEQQEAKCFSEHYRNVPPKITNWLGVRLINIGRAKALIAAGIDILAFNRVIGLGMEGAVTENDIDETIAAYHDAGVSRFFVQISPHAKPEMLSTLLTAKGFQHHNNWVKLTRKVERLPQVNSRLRIVEINKEYADRFADIIIKCFEWPEALGPMIALPVGHPGWKHYLAYHATKLAGCAALFFNGQYASLAFAATLPEYRGLGVQSALITHRFDDAATLGCRWMFTETAEDTPEKPVASYRNMRRFGFEAAYKRPNYLFQC